MDCVYWDTVPVPLCAIWTTTTALVSSKMPLGNFLPTNSFLQLYITQLCAHATVMEMIMDTVSGKDRFTDTVTDIVTATVTDIGTNTCTDGDTSTVTNVVSVSVFARYESFLIPELEERLSKVSSLGAF